MAEFSISSGSFGGARDPSLLRRGLARQLERRLNRVGAEGWEPLVVSAWFDRVEVAAPGGRVRAHRLSYEAVLRRTELRWQAQVFAVGRRVPDARLDGLVMASEDELGWRVAGYTVSPSEEAGPGGRMAVPPFDSLFVFVRAAPEDDRDRPPADE